MSRGGLILNIFSAKLTSMQLSLFGGTTVGIDEGFSGLQRKDLGRGAWVEWVPGWLSRHDLLFGQLAAAGEHGATWQAQETVMYERRLPVPRLLGKVPVQGQALDTLRDMSRCLSRRYGLELGSVGLALYRDGNDSVALHGDKMGPLVDDTIVAVVALGGPRPFLLKPATGGRSLKFSSGQGDLIVMGGTCQRTFVHGVPKVRRAAARIAVMFRPELPLADPLRMPLTGGVHPLSRSA